MFCALFHQCILLRSFFYATSHNKMKRRRNFQLEHLIVFSNRLLKLRRFGTPYFMKTSCDSYSYFRKKNILISFKLLRFCKFADIAGMRMSIVIQVFLNVPFVWLWRQILSRVGWPFLAVESWTLNPIRGADLESWTNGHPAHMRTYCS